MECFSGIHFGANTHQGCQYKGQDKAQFGTQSEPGLSNAGLSFSA